VEGEGYYLGGAYSNGSTDQVNGLLDRGAFVSGKGANDGVTAFIHTHPVNFGFSGSDAAFRYGSVNPDWNTPYAFGNSEGDLVTAYLSQVNAYVAVGNNLYSWSYSSYVQAQAGAMGTPFRPT